MGSAKAITNRRDTPAMVYGAFVIIAIGVLARCVDIAYNFDGDELSSVTLASSALSELFVGWPHSAHPPLHIVVLKIWISLFGATEVAVRALSIVASAIFLYVANLIFRRLPAGWVGLGALLILAISPYFVYYSQQARPFAFVALFTVLNLLAFMDMTEQPESRKQEWYWAITCLLLIYTQYQSIVLIGFQCLLIIFCAPDRCARLLGKASIAVVAIVPWIAWVMGPALEAGGDPMPNISWIEEPGLKEFFWFFATLFGSIPQVQTRWLLLGLVLLGVFFAWHVFTERKITQRQILFVLAGPGLIAIVFLVSVLGPKPVFGYRHLIGGGFAFIVLVAVISQCLPKHVATVTMFFLVAWTIVAFPNNVPSEIKPPWRDVAVYLDDNYPGASVLVPENWVLGPLSYYRNKGNVELWTSAGEKTQDKDPILIVCRPQRCQHGSFNGGRASITPMKTWSWGGNSKHLRLFEIHLSEVSAR